MTPSELLTRAADLIRDAAAAATDGPWFTHDAHLNEGGHTATVLSGVYPEGQLRAWLPTWSHEPWDETRNVWNDAKWIALLSPAVAPWLERMLRHRAEVIVWAESWDQVADIGERHLAEHVIAVLGEEAHDGR